MANPISTVSFTPGGDGVLICTATYTVQQTGTASDFGPDDPGTVIRLHRNSDSAVLATGEFQPASRTRTPQTHRVRFNCLASNGAQTVTLRGQGGAPGTAILFWDIDLTVELIKR